MLSCNGLIESHERNAAGINMIELNGYRSNVSQSSSRANDDGSGGCRAASGTGGYRSCSGKLSHGTHGLEAVDMAGPVVSGAAGVDGLTAPRTTLYKSVSKEQDNSCRTHLFHNVMIPSTHSSPSKRP
jgi:hypothetical protein